jgi:hypothetical protein
MPEPPEGFLIVDVAPQLVPVQLEEDLHGCVCHALVAIDEGMIADEREGKCRRLVEKRCVQVLASEGRTGLGNGRLKGTKVANGPRLLRTVRSLDDAEQVPLPG